MGTGGTFNAQRTGFERSETPGDVKPAAAPDLPHVDPDLQHQRELVVSELRSLIC